MPGYLLDMRTPGLRARTLTPGLAGYVGCTTEFRKWEGITYDAKHNKLYTAISAVQYGMEDNMKKGDANTAYDEGTPNHLKMKHNGCGCVMEMDVNDHSMAETFYAATKARMLTCGLPNPDASSPDSCVITRIASPDNVAMIPDYNQLIIGEDTSGHQNDLIWIYDLASGAMTRIGSSPYGSETTSPYWYTIGDWQYMTFVVQHPYGESDQGMLAEAEATGMKLDVRALFSTRCRWSVLL